MFLVPGIVLGAAVTAADAKSGSPDLTVPLVNVDRQARFQSNQQNIRQANDAFVKGNYDEAIKLYLNVKKQLAGIPGDKFAREIKHCDQQIQNCYLKKAEEAMSRADKSVAVGDFDNAIKVCQEAIEACPEYKDKLDAKIKLYNKRRTAAKEREAYSIEKLEPDFQAQEYQIELLIEQGRALTARGQYMKARRKFEEVLLLDPYNAAATQNLLGINDKIRKSAILRANATARRFMGKTEWDGAIPVVRDIPVGNPENQLHAPVGKAAMSAAERKIRSIVIPRFDFEKTSFAEVMQTLNDAVRINDPDKIGINLIIKDRDIKGGQQELVLDTYSKRNVTPFEVLNDLKKNGSLTFKISNNAVFVAAKDVPLEQLEVKVFAGIDVPSEIKTDKELRNYLAATYGINFDIEGTDVRKKSDHVIACHTPENLKKIGDALNQLSSKPTYLVQIMFKFIEVAQKDLDELAFNWQYARTGAANTQFGVNSGNTLLRHYGFGDDANVTAFDGSAVDGNTKDAQFNFSWADSHNSLGFSVYALDWADQNTILYAPRVTTLDRQTALVNMTEKHYYPDEWETIDSENNEDSYVYVDGAQPDLSDEQELGVKFQIRPEIDGDPTTGKARVRAVVNIPIKQFYDWLEFNNTIPPIPGKDADDDGEYIKKPIFTQRSINTEVSIRDGETVMIASISNDIIKSIHDKVPILGDLPLIGRLFQARYTNSQKVNLMVFMTCQIIKPDGSPASKRPLPDNGLPRFPRNQ